MWRRQNIEKAFLRAFAIFCRLIFLPENMEMNENRRSLSVLLFCLLTAFLTLLFTSRSSFLYITNNWNDVNSYFTMGKGMMNGLVLYRDLYDQKGPYLYLLNGIAYLISRRSFFGIFLFEVAAAAFSLYYIYKTAVIFCKSETAMLLLPLASAGIYSSLSFYQGGAAEEYCLPFLIYSLYVLFRISGLTEIPSKEELARHFGITGFFAGIITLVKYTMLGFYLGFAVAAFLFLLYAREKAKNIVKYILVFLICFMIPFVPWLIYFGVHGALDDLYRCYVYNNIFHYSALSEHTENAGSRLYELAKYAYWLIFDNLSYFVMIFIGFFGMLFGKGNPVRRLFLPFIFAVTFFVIFFGGNTLPYYSIPLMAFCGAGVGMSGKLIDLVIKKRSIPVFTVLTTAVLLLSVFGATRHCISYDYLRQPKEGFWLTDFKKIVEKEEAPTLLNIGAVDAGLYTVTGIVPTCEYFQTNGIDLPVMFEEQFRYIKEGRTMFILVCSYDFEHLHIHYDKVAEAVYEGQTFSLYKKVR